ncbi:MAG: hypothetical protein MK135_15190, partial [Polyangiaceae bacterium]|nr:hypothetical protein [Polyangiaceae bacterium]
VDRHDEEQGLYRVLLAQKSRGAFRRAAHLAHNRKELNPPSDALRNLLSEAESELEKIALQTELLLAVPPDEGQRILEDEPAFQPTAQLFGTLTEQITSTALPYRWRKRRKLLALLKQLVQSDSELDGAELRNALQEEAREHLSGANLLLSWLSVGRPHQFHHRFDPLLSPLNEERSDREFCATAALLYPEPPAELTSAELTLLPLYEACLNPGEAPASTQSLMPTPGSSALLELLLSQDEMSQGSPEAVKVWEARAKWAQNEKQQPATQQAYARLAELARAQGDEESASLWHQALVETDKIGLPGLLLWEASALTQSSFRTWLAVQKKLKTQLPASDQGAYFRLEAAISLGKQDAAGALAALQNQNSGARRSELSQRLLFNQARLAQDDKALVQALGELLGIQPSTLPSPEESKPAPLKTTDTKPTTSSLPTPEQSLSFQLSEVSHADQATLSCEYFAVLVRLGKLEDACEFWEQNPPQQKDFLSLLYQANYEYLRGGVRPDTFVALSETSSIDEHAYQFCLNAGDSFLKANQRKNAAEYYQRALQLQPDSTHAFQSLLSLYESEDDQLAKLDLLELSLHGEISSEAELTRSLDFVESALQLNQIERALSYSQLSLSFAPHNRRVLRLHAKAMTAAASSGSDHEKLNYYREAVSSLEALLQLELPGSEEYELRLQLAQLYRNNLSAPERAMDALEGALKQAPHEPLLLQELVTVYLQLNLTERATAAQTQLIQFTSNDITKREAVLSLARIYEEVAGEPKKAAATLEKARKAWPLNADVLKASAEFLSRFGQDANRKMLIAQSSKDAVRKLRSGNFDPDLMRVLEVSAQLSGSAAQARAAQSAHRGIVGEACELEGIALAALSHGASPSVVPEGWTVTFGRLLEKAAPALDAAFPAAIAGSSLTKLEDGPLHHLIQAYNQEHPGAPVQVFLSPTLDYASWPLTTSPPRIAVGDKLAQLPLPEQQFILLRSLQALQMGASALARISSEEAGYVLAALLQLFAPNWTPPGDERKLGQLRALLEEGLAKAGYDADLPILALETIGALGGTTPAALADLVV